MDNNNSYALIIGAGPSGLALAYELIELNSHIKPIIIDKLSQTGGLSRTIYNDGSGIDIGGHRLFTNNKYVQDIWERFLSTNQASGSDDVLMIKKRFSSIIKNSKKFRYPLKFSIDTFKKLGVKSSVIAILSYFKSLIFTRQNNTVEDLLINRFGAHIYKLFFKEHTKKIWGYDANEIINDWQKIRIQRSLFSFKKTLWEDEFYYPKYGCSQLWDKMAQYIIDNGGKIILNCEFKNFKFSDNKIVSAFTRCNNEIIEIPAKYFISSIPLCDLIKTIDAPYDIKQNALNLPYRDYILVSLYTNKFNLKNDTEFPTKRNITPENWIYMQEEGTIASRMQIMNNWSEYLVDRGYLISLEYFCSKGDKLWSMTDDELVKLAISESEKYNLFKKYNVYNSKVTRVEKAYPVYAASYRHIGKIREHLKNYSNLYIMGRNGEHKYINMDYAMVCGITIARDINKKDM